MTSEAIWSLLVLVWGLTVLVLIGRCSYYLKHLLAETRDKRGKAG